MPYAPIAIPLTFSNGVDTRTDPKSVPPVKLLALENGVFGKATTIAKRNGYDALTANVDPSGEYKAPRALAARGDELVLMTTTDAYSFRESSETWSRIGPVASIAHTERTIAATGTDQSMPDFATAGGVRVTAWEDSLGGIWWSVDEESTLRVLRPPALLTLGGTQPRVAHTGGGIVLILYTDEGGGRIMVAPVDVANYATTPLELVVTADLSLAAPRFDAMQYGGTGAGADRAVIAWNRQGGGFRVGYLDGTGVLASSPAVATHAVASAGPISVAWIDGSTPYGGEVIGVSVYDGADVDAYVLESSILSSIVDSGAVIAGVAAVRIASTFTTDGSVATGTQTETRLVAWAEAEGDTPRDNRVTIGSLASAVVGPNATLRGHGIVSRGFTDGLGLADAGFLVPGGACVILAHEVPFYPYAALTRWSDVDTAPAVACLGRLVVGTSDGMPVRSHLTTVEQDATDPRVWRVALLAREQVLVEATTPPTPPEEQFTETGIQIVTLDFDAADAYQTVEFGRDLVLAGACPMRYDGDTFAELGFHCAPDQITSATGAGGALTADSTYLYMVNYEEVDAAGEIHPGPMSIFVLVALGALDTFVALTIPTYRLTSKRTVRIAVWRTVADDQADDPLFYRVSSLNPSATGDNGYVTNDATIDEIEFTDAMSDADLIAKERAYTNSGVLSNDTIPLGHVVAASKERIFWNDPTDPQVVRYTQTRRVGYGPEIADLPLVTSPHASVSALAVLDDALLMFTASEVSYVAGPGPLANPDAAPQIGFSPPIIITGDVGCTSQRSLAVTADRVLFQSARGIHQINRGRQVAYVGADVEAFNAQTVVSADAVPGKKQVIFLTSTEGGKSLLYDYYYDQWSTFTNHVGLDGVIAGGVYHYLRAGDADKRVFRASTTNYRDATSEIRLHIETAWIKLLGYHQGLHKIWHALFLGTYKSPHTLRVRVALDYRPGWGEAIDLDVDTNYDPALYGESGYGDGPYGGDGDTLYQRRVHLDAKCQAIRFSIEDVTSGTPLGASFELTELLLHGGAVKRTANISAARSS